MHNKCFHQLCTAYFKIVLIETSSLNKLPALLKKEIDAVIQTLNCHIPVIYRDVRETAGLRYQW